MGERHKDSLFNLARDRFDWSSVARTFRQELSAL
jgi:hypothetical protein